MDALALQRYLHEHIPLSAAMGAEVVEAGCDAVLLRAPLAPNINHRETAFGGSVSSLAILAAWSLVHVRLADAGPACRLVIQRNAIDYTAPIAGDFTARSSLTEPERWDRFVHLLARKGRARVNVSCLVESAGVAAARFEGDFVAIDTRTEVPR